MVDVTPIEKSKKKPSRRAGQPGQATRARVMDRCGGWCEIGTYNCEGRATQLHHVKRRSQGGGHDEPNLKGVCDGCHVWIHHNVAQSKERGWLA